MPRDDDNLTFKEEKLIWDHFEDYRSMCIELPIYDDSSHQRWFAAIKRNPAYAYEPGTRAKRKKSMPVFVEISQAY